MITHKFFYFVSINSFCERFSFLTVDAVQWAIPFISLGCVIFNFRTVHFFWSYLPDYRVMCFNLIVFLSGIVVVTESITGLIIFFSKVVLLSFSGDIYLCQWYSRSFSSYCRYIEVTILLNSWLLSFSCKYVTCAVYWLFVFVCVALHIQIN